MSRTVLLSLAAESRIYLKDSADALKDSEQGGACSFCRSEKITLGAVQEELCKDLIGARATSVEERIKALRRQMFTERRKMVSVNRQMECLGNVSLQALVRLPPISRHVFKVQPQLSHVTIFKSQKTTPSATRETPWELRGHKAPGTQLHKQPYFHTIFSPIISQLPACEKWGQ